MKEPLFFPWSCVNFSLDHLNFLLTYVLKISTVWYVLSYESVCVFDATFLPCCMRIGKVHFYAQLSRNVLMTEEFRPVVSCDGLYPFSVWFQQVYYR